MQLRPIWAPWDSVSRNRSRTGRKCIWVSVSCSISVANSDVRSQNLKLIKKPSVKYVFVCHIIHFHTCLKVYVWGMSLSTWNPSTWGGYKEFKTSLGYRAKPCLHVPQGVFLSHYYKKCEILGCFPGSVTTRSMHMPGKLSSTELHPQA